MGRPRECSQVALIEFGSQPAGGHFRVDPGGVGALVTEQVLDRGQITGLFDEVSRKPSAKAVGCDQQIGQSGVYPHVTEEP